MRSSRSGSPISPSSPVSRKQAWLLAARPATLPAAVVPVLVGTALAAGQGRYRLLVAFVALVTSVLIQIGTNLANDVFDFKKGADTAERLGPVRVTQAGLLSERQVTAGMLATFGLAALGVVYLVFAGGWPIFWIGVFSIASGIAYTGGPWPLGYNGLGDLFVFVFFGLIAVMGTYFLNTGTVDAVAFWTSIPIGLLVTAILVVNNLRDIETDRAAGKRTLAVRIGPPATRAQYALFVLGAYLVPLAFWWWGAAPGSPWLPLFSLPLAISLVRTVLSGARGPALNPVLKRTGQLELIFGLLMAAGFLL